MQVDHIIALATRFTEQRPCDGIQQDDLPAPLCSRNAGEIERAEIKFDRIKIRKKTCNAEVNGNHNKVYPADNETYPVRSRSVCV